MDYNYRYNASHMAKDICFGVSKAIINIIQIFYKYKVFLTTN